MPASPHPRRRSRTASLRLIGVAALGLALLTSGAPAPPTASGDELSEARAAQQALESRIASQQALVARLTRSEADLSVRIAAATNKLGATVSDLQAARRQISGLKASLETVRADYRRLVQEVAGLDAGLAKTQAAEAAKREELRARKEQLADRIRSAYEASQRSPFEAIVSGASFTDLLVEASSQLDAAEQDRILARQIVRDRATLVALASALRVRRAQATTLRQAAAVQKAALGARLKELRSAESRLTALRRRTEALLAAQRADYALLAQNKARLRSSIAAAERAQRRLESRIKRLIEAQVDRGGIPSSFSGTMRWPMPGAVSQDYGCTGFEWEPPRGSCAHFHSGIDIVAPYGTAVRAAAPGRVVFIGYNPYDDPRDPAWIVIVAHSASIQTWYAHLQPRRPVRVGDTVRAGQVIGYEGSTGRSTGAHLDWRVMRNGEFVNPRLFL